MEGQGLIAAKLVNNRRVEKSVWRDNLTGPSCSTAVSTFSRAYGAEPEAIRPTGAPSPRSL
jgi:hypothetical protein